MEEEKDGCFPMNILAIESSCDETAVALVRDGRTVLADCIASSVEMHKLTAAWCRRSPPGSTLR